MRFPITSSNGSGPSVSATNYGGLFSAFSGTEGQHQVPFSDACSVFAGGFRLATAPGGSASWTITLRKNGVDTGLTCTITGSAVTGTWSGGGVAFAIGDRISASWVPAGTPTASGAVVGYALIETTGDKFFVLGLVNSAVSTTVTNYNSLNGNPGGWVTVATDAEMVVPMACTMTALAIRTTAPGTLGSGKSYAASVRLNDTTDYLTATVIDTAVAASATGSQAVSAGDRVVLKVVPSGSPTSSQMQWCATFSPGTSGEIFMGLTSSTTVTGFSTTQYQGLWGRGYTSGSWSTEAARSMPITQDYAVKNLYARSTSALASGKSFALTVRNNLTDTALTCTISGPGQSASDISHTATLTGATSGGIATIRSVPSGSPSAVIIHASVVIVWPQPILGVIAGTSSASASGFLLLAIHTPTRLATNPHFTGRA